MQNPFEPTGFEVDLSDYDNPPTPAPTAGEMDPSNFEPQYPFTDGMETETDE